MKKTIAAYSIILAFLCACSYSIKNVYKEWRLYSELTGRANNIFIILQDLSIQVNKAAVLNPNLSAAIDASKEINIFYADSLSILQSLSKLKSIVRDSINIKIVHQLDLKLKSELSWIIKSNVPDSMIHHQAKAHIIAFEGIHLLIMRGIERTTFLRHYREAALEKALKKMAAWIFIFALIIAILLVYTIINLFRQYNKRREKEVQLAQKEIQHRQILDNMLEGVQIHDFNWRYTYVNDSLVKYSQYSREELVGKTLMEKYPGIEKSDLFKVLEVCMKDRQPRQMETEFIFPDGSRADFDLSIQAVPEGIFILSVDKTEKNIARKKLTKANRLYSFLSAINQSIVHINSEAELLDNVSRIATEIGQFKLAYVGLLDDKNLLSIASLSGDKEAAARILKINGLDPNDPAMSEVPTVKVLKTGVTSFNNDMQNDPFMSRWKPEFVMHGIHASISLPVSKFGKVVGVLGFHAGTKDFFDTEETALLEEAAGDISFALENLETRKKHKETEDLLLKNEKRFRGLIEKSSDLKTLTDKEGRFTYGSPSVFKTFGYSMEEFLGRHAMLFFHPNDVADLIKKRNSILNKPGQSYYFQNRVLHRDGTWIWCEGTVTNLLDEPAIMAMVSNFRDITQSRKSAVEKEIFISHLTQNNHDLQQFAYITSHNLRGPIANLLGLTNLLENYKIKDPTLSKILNGIRSSTLMFDETVKDLATMLSIRNNNTVHIESLSFEDVFEKVTNLYQTTIIESKAEIVSDFKQVKTIDFNKSYLESIFINLLSNAIKYRDESRTLKITVRSFLNEGLVTLKFNDNGIGFDSEQQKEKVFSLYQRFHTHKEGKGLGLFLIKSQLEALGGIIAVKSQPDEGAEFTITFNKSK